MIISALLLVLGAFLRVVLALVTNAPDVAPPEMFASAITTIAPLLSGLDSIFPFVTLWALVGIDVIFESSYFGYKGVRWVYRKIPGVS